MYADYSFYTTVYYGSRIEEADFPRLSAKASDFLDYYTKGKAAAVEDTAVLTLLGKACCAVAEAMKSDEVAQAIADKASASALASDSPELKSETVGSYSVTYATSLDYAGAVRGSAVRNKRGAYADAAFEYLSNTGLLYRGGC